MSLESPEQAIAEAQSELKIILSTAWWTRANHVWCERLFLGKFDWHGLAEHVVNLHNESIKPNPLEK